MQQSHYLEPMVLIGENDIISLRWFLVKFSYIEIIIEINF